MASTPKRGSAKRRKISERLLTNKRMDSITKRLKLGQKGTVTETQILNDFLEEEQFAVGSSVTKWAKNKIVAYVSFYNLSVHDQWYSSV